MNITIKRVKYFDPKSALGKTLSESVEETTKVLQRKARKEVPVDTGFLRASIKRVINKFIGSITVWARYGKFVEYGTMYNKANPFFRRALEYTERRLPSIIRKAWKRNMK